MTRSHMSIHLLLAFAEIVLRAEAGLIPASWTEYEQCKKFQKKDLWLVHVSIRLSVFMPLGHPNLKQDVACNQNYSISNFKSIWHEESERMMGWWDKDSRMQTAWSHVVGHDTQRHGVQDPHLKNSRLKPKTRTSVQPWSKSLIQSRRLLIVW